MVVILIALVVLCGRYIERLNLGLMLCEVCCETLWKSEACRGARVGGF